MVGTTTSYPQVLAGGPAVLFEIVRRRSENIRHGVDDVAMPVAVEIHSIFLNAVGMNWVGPKAPAQDPTETVRPHIAALEYLQCRQEFLAEITLPAPNACERRGRTEYRAFADERAVVGFNAPDGREDVAIDTEGPLNGVKRAAIFFKQRAALLDAVVRDEDVQIVPEGFGELRLVIEQIHDPQIGRQRSGVVVKHASRNAARAAACHNLSMQA